MLTSKEEYQLFMYFGKQGNNRLISNLLVAVRNSHGVIAVPDSGMCGLRTPTLILFFGHSLLQDAYIGQHRHTSINA